MQVTRSIDHTLYPRKALADATQAYRDYCDVRITPFNSQKSHVTIRVKEVHDGSPSEVILEFLNYALDRSLQIQLEKD